MPIVTIDLPSRNKSTVGWWLESILCVVSDTIFLGPGGVAGATSRLLQRVILSHLSNTQRYQYCELRCDTTDIVVAFGQTNPVESSTEG